MPFTALSSSASYFPFCSGCSRFYLKTHSSRCLSCRVSLSPILSESRAQGCPSHTRLNTPQPRAPRRTSHRTSPLRPCTPSQHSSDSPARPHRTHSAQPDRFFSSSEEYAKAWLDRKPSPALSRLYGSRRGWESGGDDVLELSRSVDTTVTQIDNE